ncbi:hypothetical protein GCM10018779_44080 [Streptomyces griseocarneus]|nr:hypothetical protein GCM10018779_44080 [Streptomyces griseocarneus]
MDAVHQGEGAQVEDVRGQEPQQGETFLHGSTLGRGRACSALRPEFRPPPRIPPCAPDSGLRPGVRRRAAPYAPDSQETV